MRVLIGASTGGVEAILDILSKFPCNCPPTFIVQHTGSRFVEGLVNLFNQVTEAQVCVATNREPVAAGKIYIAPNGGKHLELAGNGGSIMRIVDRPPVSGHSPSVDRLFSSAVSFAPKISAALLTGMGSDGAKGLMKLRHAGAKTFAQDEESSIVYGMPRVAVELGAVEKQAHLSKIGDYLLDACRIDCKQV